MNFTLTDEQRMLVALAEQVAASLPPESDPDSYPFEATKSFAKAGLTGITIPEDEGGQSGTLVDSVLAIQAVARTHARASDILQATNFGAIRQIATFGSPEQKETYLRPVLTGDALVTVAMTEPEAGSAATQLRTEARYANGDVVINGTKIFNSEGPYATHHVVWVRFGDDVRSIGSVIVPTDAPGFSRGKAERFLSGEAHCELIFQDCRVPANHVLIAENGFGVMMQQFNVERLGNAARSLGCGQRALRIAVEHAKQRHQFGRPIADFQGLQWRLAEAKIALDGAELLLYRAASATDGTPGALETAVAKCACNEAGYRAADTALQILGGTGFSTESELGYLLMRTRGWMIAGGSVEMMRNRIAEALFERKFPQRPPRES